jgi:hypothetical protein
MKDKHLYDYIMFAKETQVYLSYPELIALFFKFVVEYVIRKDHENQGSFEVNMTHRLLAYVDDINLLGQNTNTIHKTRKIYYPV